MTPRDEKILAEGWYFTTTLLACLPNRDINIRRLYHGPTMVAEFNTEMALWEVWKDEALQRACDEFNKLEGL